MGASLLVDGCQHALEGKLDGIDGLIDNFIETDINAFLVGHGFGQHVGTDIETDDNGVGG